MRDVLKSGTKARWPLILFSFLLALAFLGCQEKTQSVRYILPKGFHGLFQLSEDRQKGVDLVKSNGVLFITVPTNGVIVIKDCSFQFEWHRSTAVFPDGKVISEEDFDTNAIVLHELSPIGSTNWILVGTDREADIARNMIFKPMPLARPLSEDDISR